LLPGRNVAAGEDDGGGGGGDGEYCDRGRR
jgi:hypothetical protein